MPWYTDIWVGYATTPSQPLLSGGFPRGLGFWVISPEVYMSLCLQFEYQDTASLCLADDFLSSGAMGGSSGYYLPRSFPQAMVCKCSMEKMGETAKTSGKHLLWPFWPMMHLSSCPRDAAGCGLQGSHTRSPLASGFPLPFWPSPSCLQLL